MQIIETNSNRAPIVVVYGNEGRGKTSLASRFHNAVWFLLERGLPRGVTVEAAEGVDSFEGVMNGLRHLYSAEQGWVAADETWRRFLSGVSALRDKRGMTVVLTCHATIERVEDPRAPTYTAYAPKLHKRARALVMDAADIVGFLAEDLRVVTDDGGFRERTRAAAGNGRFLFVEGCPAFNAKNRFGMPAKIPIPLDFDIANLTQHWT
jgi:AAA domain